MQKQWTIVATAAFGLEALVKRELEEMGYADISIEDGRIYFQGGAKDVALANMKLRTADRVLIEVARFEARSFEELFDQTKRIAWGDWIPADGKFPVKGRSYKSQLASVSDSQAIVKKAIATKLQTRWTLDWLPETGATFPIEVAIRRDVVSLTLDTTGEGLFKRGYRERKGGAPLKETLAAALLALSYWKPGRPLVDPFCGSGTILIEAAMKGRNMAPGLERKFLAMDWKTVGMDVFQEARRQCLAEIDWDVELDLLGFDIDAKVLLTARANAEKAGVGDDIQFVVKDMKRMDLQDNFGVVITNPPYGVRLGEEKEAEELTRTLGKKMGELSTWSVYVITAQLGFERFFGREADKKRKLFNGGIETTYYQYYGPNPDRFL